MCFFSVFMGSYTSGLAVFGDARGTSPSCSIPIGPASLFYSIRFRKWSFFVAAFTLRRFESQMKLDAGAAHDGDGPFSSPPH